ncbi:hypothetical protein [Pantoea sp. SORGH_AS_0659]|uniref:hypothetical protein n=1 Tax=Pantoea sp. SORGH_AS_0659 TaxID=3062597 RepID=UPI002858F71E|nr:hypothetical protein [Pantoea sp. SORGH_AS_0659]MDR6352531.1 putative nucleic acid-binding protein [Pantoea sp. SORGH_AS_0659]
MTTSIGMPSHISLNHPGDVTVFTKKVTGNESTRASVSPALLDALNKKQDRDAIMAGMIPDPGTGCFDPATPENIETNNAPKSDVQLRVEKAITENPADSLDNHIARAGFDITSFDQHNRQLRSILEKFQIEMQQAAAVMQSASAKLSEQMIAAVVKAGKISVQAAKTNATNAITTATLNIGMGVASAGVSTFKTNKMNKQLNWNNNQLAALDKQKAKLNSEVNNVMNRKGGADAASRKHAADAIHKNTGIDTRRAELMSNTSSLTNTYNNSMGNIVAARTAVTAGTQAMNATMNVDVVKQEQEAKRVEANARLQESLRNTMDKSEQRASELQHKYADTLKQLLEAEQQNQKGNIGRM